MRDYSFYILLFLIVLSTYNPRSMADTYTITKGKGAYVCDSYKKYLDSVKGSQPLVCGRYISSDFDELRTPKWSKVDLNKHRDLLRRILRYRNGVGNQHDKWFLKDKETLDYKIKYFNNEDRVLMSKLDVNNDGVYENIIKFKEGVCPEMQSGFFKTSFYIIKKSKEYNDFIIDQDNKIEKLLRNNKKIRNASFASMDIFIQNRKVYFDKFCFDKNDSKGCEDKNILSVYYIDKMNIHDVCKFKMKTDKQFKN